MVTNRRHTERTRPAALGSSQPPVKHYIHVNGLKMNKFLKHQTKYWPRYPQLQATRSPPVLLAHPIDPRPPQFQLSDLECLKVLGEGSTGQVLLVRSKRAGHPLDNVQSLYALKVFSRKNARFTDKQDPTDKDLERSILTKLPWSPFVSGIIQVFRDEKNLYKMLEYIPCGSLRGLLRKRAPFNATTSAFYFCNIAAGIEFLEAHDVYHRDLKPENILVGTDGYLVLADFGEGAHEYDYENTSWMQIGSPAYSAPEMMSNNLDGTQMSSSGVDWWSAGIILYEMTYKKLPWWGRNQLDIHRKKASGVVHWPLGIKVGDQLRSLVLGLLTVDTTVRLGVNGAQEVMKHPWLKQIKWSKIKGRAYLAPYVPPKPLGIEDTWHTFPLPSRRKIPGLGKIIEPTPRLGYNDCFPAYNVEGDDADREVHEELDRHSNWPFHLSPV